MTVAVLTAPGAAWADDPPSQPCPAKAESLDSAADPIAIEIREMRREQAEDCSARRWEADRAHDDSVQRGTATAAQADRAHDDAVTAAGKLDAIATAIIEQGSATTASVRLDDDSRAFFAGAFDGLNGTAWYAIGGAFALILVGGFVWVTRPER